MFFPLPLLLPEICVPETRFAAYPIFPSSQYAAVRSGAVLPGSPYPSILLSAGRSLPSRVETRKLRSDHARPEA